MRPGSSVLFLMGAVAFVAACGSSSKPQVKQCARNSDCSSPLVCGQGYCVGQCVTGRDCPGDQDCIILTGAGNVCQAPAKKSCQYNSNCSPLFCGVDLQCRNQCLGDVDCPNGDKCADDANGTKLCVDPVKDAANYDSTTNQIKPAPDAGVATSGNGGAGGGAAGDNAPGGHAGGGAIGQAGMGGVAGGAGQAGGAGGGAPAGHPGNGGAGGSGGAGGAIHYPPAAWRLWVLENTTKHIYGYNPAQLLSTNGDGPEIDLAVQGSNLTLNSLEFDPSGNLWISLSQSNEGYLWRVDVSQLAAGGSVTPSAVLATVGAYNGWTGSLIFDGAGNLWANEINPGDPGNSPGTIARFNVATVAGLTTTSGTVTPDFAITNRSGPPGIAIDAAGNLYTWLATGYDPVGRYDAAQLVGSGVTSDPPALTIPRFTSKTYSAAGLLLTAGGLAAAANDLYLFSKSQIAQSGAPASLPPQADITFPSVSGFQPYYLAQDPDGNLFVSGGVGKIIKVAAADIAGATGAVTLAPVMTVRAPNSNPSATFFGIVVH